MRRAILALVIVLGLMGSASAGTAQMKSEKKESQWDGSIICSKGQGKGKFSLTLIDDSTYRSKWEVNCLGARVMGSGRGGYRLEGSDFSFRATGHASADIGASSGYTITFSGNLLEMAASGTWQISFEEDEWPSDLNGAWNVEKVK
jgi:hypothetical protein